MSLSALPSPRPAGLLSPDGRGHGLRQAVALRQGLTLARTDVTFDHETDARLECHGSFLRFHFRLEGDSVVSDDRGESSSVSAGTILLVAQPADSYKRERAGINTHERSVTLICDRDYAAELIRQADATPSFLDDFLRNDVSGFSFLERTMPMKIRPIVEDILDPPLTGRLSEVLIEAKALELLCYTIHQILRVPEQGAIIREKDRKRVRDLCFILEQDPAAPISIDLLCRELAWNDTQMTECFKAVTGITISNYRQQVRMRYARRQLEETDLPITQIAFDSGYEYPSNFTTAFKRTFGVSPRDVRR
ncbi:AraC family transcriptional regulator [Sphingobium amiense]|uniref:AraC family transcriptional regulator n=1 Tax=Sphingobium amiense TaxID=135719 RepID=A0A494W8T4_9SPHN|nr:AraC family transcriptional regulator [Sphingobium amiense]BBD96792.1 AraC family transcriptional regulator [Sphingobium amiense]